MGDSKASLVGNAETLMVLSEKCVLGSGAEMMFMFSAEDVFGNMFFSRYMFEKLCVLVNRCLWFHV